MLIMYDIEEIGDMVSWVKFYLNMFNRTTILIN